MKIQLVRIADRGVPNQERVHLSVVAEVDLAFFVIMKNVRVGTAYDHVLNGGAASFWFPNVIVKPGDQVVIFSGKGTASSKQEPSGSTTYFYYWNFDTTLWNKPADCVVIFEASEYVTSPLGQ